MTMANRMLVAMAEFPVLVRLTLMGMALFHLSVIRVRLDMPISPLMLFDQDLIG
jgi:hypothetical protein